MKLKLFILIFFIATSSFAQESNKLEKSLLWEISGNGLSKKSYLFGTVHIQDRRVYGVNDSILPKLKTCDVIATEISFEMDTVMKVSKAMIVQNEKDKLVNLLPDSSYRKIKKAARKHLSFTEMFLFDRIKPIFVSSLFTNSFIKKDGKYPLDVWLVEEAKKDSIVTDNIEYVDEQIAVFNLQTPKEQASELLKMVNDIDSCKRELTVLTDAYLNQDLPTIDSLMNAAADSSNQKFMDALLKNRNKTMAKRIDQKIQTRSYFVAVGAGHLGGNEGIIQLLISRGYTLRPILPNKTKD